jgi:hypothetical protein
VPRLSNGAVAAMHRRDCVVSEAYEATALVAKFGCFFRENPHVYLAVD